MSSSIILYDAGGNPIEFDADRMKFGLATAWAKMAVGNNGQDILDSYNIASVIRLGTGRFEITFATPMDNANYVVQGMHNRGNMNSSNICHNNEDVGNSGIVNTVTQFRTAHSFINPSSASAQDPSLGWGFVVFGGKN